MNINQYGQYFIRHRVLFNLYSFDKVRSNNTHTPTLELDNCDFKYFLGNQTALIQLETNNLGLQGLYNLSQSTLLENTAFFGFYGEDRGVQIHISNSTFKHSKFCRGLIYVKARLNLISQIGGNSRVVNYTAQGPTRPGGDFN